MAEGFEPYHVPQQNRRDKLRILSQNLEFNSLQGLLPLYDPSDHLLPCNTPNNDAVNCLVKQEPSRPPPNFMGSGPSYLDQMALQPVNPNPFLYNQLHHAVRDFDQAYRNGGLSLSLSSHDTHHNSQLPLELNLQRYGQPVFAVPAAVVGTSSPDEASRCSFPLGPFTGYASVLKGSRFLKPAQQLLEDFSDVGRTIPAEKLGSNSDSSSLLDGYSASGIDQDDALAGDMTPESRRKKSKLLSMLEEVYQKYKQYYQQMQAIVASFECVAGLGNAAPYAILSVRAMSKHFRCLKNAILDQLQFTNKHHGEVSPMRNQVSRFGSTDKSPFAHRPYADHQAVWRPQRGLPERAVTVLRAWLFEHFLHPYPTDTDKIMLAKQTGLSRSQVSNWFINARVRLWKPMVEEIHMLETKQGQKSSQKEQNREANKLSDHLSSKNSLLSENPSTSPQRIRVDATSKRSRSELPDLPEDSQPPHLTYTSHPHLDIGSGLAAAAGSSNGVSLTLALQNNGITMAEPPFSMNAAQRFGMGMEGTSEGYVMSGFEAQNRHFGAVQLLHDFVG